MSSAHWQARCVWTADAPHGFLACVARDESCGDDSRRSGTVPLIESCPACGAPVEGQKCKVYCTNERCALYRRIIENCAGD